MKNILIIIIFLFFFSSNANADEAKRYLLKDQKVTEVLVLPFNYKDKKISDKVTEFFINELQKNKNNISITKEATYLKLGFHNSSKRLDTFLLRNSTKNEEYLNKEENIESNENIYNTYNPLFKKNKVYIYGNVKLFYSEIKNITISEFTDNSIFEHQVKIELEIFVRSQDNNDLIWKRKFSKYDFHKWLDFTKPRIGSNNIITLFNLQYDFDGKLYRKYTENEFIDIQLLKVVNILAKDLIKL